MKPLNLTVYLGGISAEREVSLRTGAAVTSALQRLGHQVTPVDVTDRTPPIPDGTDCVFIALHGEFGEDGAVQQYLHDKGVAFTGSGIEGSHISFDKILTKKAFDRDGVRTPAWQTLTSPEQLTLLGKIVVKPPAQGSSFGVILCDNSQQVADALETSFQNTSELLVEERIQGRELTVSILGDRALPAVEIRPHNGKYDYQSKYTKGATEYLCPAPLSDELEAEISSLALQAHRSSGAQVYSRVDIMLDENSVPWVLEVNTIPGMTETSLLPKAAAAVGISFDELCQNILDLSLAQQGRTA